MSNNTIVQEPSNMQEATSRVVHILDAKHEKAELQAVVCTNCIHLSPNQQDKLLEVLTEEN